MNLIVNAGVAGTSLALLTCHAAQVGAPRAVTAPAAALVGETAASGSSMPVVSADGRYIAFVSRAPNLMTNATSGSYQVFLRDLVGGNLILASANASGRAGNDHSMLPSISSNGLWIAFESEASDLVSGDTNGVSDIFVRDVAGARTLLVSGGRGPSRNPIISADGRYAAFESHTSDLVVEDGNNAQDVFVRDLFLGSVTLVSVNMFGSGGANHPSELLTITPDARFVAFWSDATDISPEATNTTGEVYVRDTQAGVTYCLTEGINIIDSRRFKTVLTPDGRYAALQELELYDPWPMVPPGAVGRVFRADVISGSVSNLNIGFGRPGRGLAISDDGSRLIFYGAPLMRNGFHVRDMSAGTNRLLLEVSTDVASFQVSRDFQNLFFTMALTNHGFQLFRHSLLTDETVLLSTNTLGQPIRSDVLSPFSIDSAGATVAFETAADDLVPRDFNRGPDIFVSDLGLLSVRHPDLPEGTGFGVGTLHRGSVSANGLRIAFLSTDNWLVLNDTNQQPDLFLYDLGPNYTVNIDRLVLSNSPIALLMSANGASMVYEGFNSLVLPSRRGALFRADLRNGQIQQLGVASSFSMSGLWQPSLSQDGRWLIVQDTGRIRLTDFRTPAVPGQASNQVVDVRYDGTREGNSISSNPTISLDGEWVVFLSRATDLVDPGADGGTGTPYPSGVPQVFARNLRQQRTRLLSITDTGAPLPTGATNPVISANARYVAFETLSGSNIYRHDLLATGRVTNDLVCTGCAQPSISGDGRFVVYNVHGLIYVHDLERALVGPIAAGPNPDATISLDGRFVVFVSPLTGVPQIYLHDRWNFATHLLSRNYHGTGGGNGPSTRAVFSHDGRTIAFQSFASDLVPGDYDNRRDIFVVQIAPVDTDGDGMDDDWEQFYFGTLTRDGFGNLDGDHLSDIQEFLAGTNPLDPASALRLTDVSSRIVPGPMQDTELKWTSAPGKTYRVQHKPDLALPWADLPGDIITGGPNGSTTHLDPANPSGFYRIRLVE